MEGKQEWRSGPIKKEEEEWHRKEREVNDGEESREQEGVGEREWEREKEEEKREELRSGSVLCSLGECMFTM